MWWKCVGGPEWVGQLEDNRGMKRREVRCKTGGDRVRFTNTPNCE